jgi:hypothetical protein
MRPPREAYFWEFSVCLCLLFKTWKDEEKKRKKEERNGKERREEDSEVQSGSEMCGAGEKYKYN